MDLENQKRTLFFEIQKETNADTKKAKIMEYLDNKELSRLKKEKLNLETTRKILITW